MDRWALLSSLMLHGLICILIFIGLPQSPPPIMPPIRALPIKLVPVGTLTQSPKRAAIKHTKLKKKDTPRPLKKKAVSAIKPAPQSAKNEPEIKPQAIEKPTKKVSKEAFDDVLGAVEDLPDEKGRAPKNAFDSDLISDKISLSELDALRQQIQRCWLVPPGVMTEKDLMVEVGVHLNVEAHVQKIIILNTPPPQKKAVFDVAAQSIHQALRAPECTPLKLPKDKYTMWKYCVLRFRAQGVG